MSLASAPIIAHRFANVSNAGILYLIAKMTKYFKRAKSPVKRNLIVCHGKFLVLKFVNLF